MQPVTQWIPKELLPVALTPLIHWAYSRHRARGFHGPSSSTSRASRSSAMSHGFHGALRSAGGAGVAGPACRPRGCDWAITRSPWSSPTISSAVGSGPRRVGPVRHRHGSDRRGRGGGRGPKGPPVWPSAGGGGRLTPVVDIADRGSRRFDAGGGDRAATPIGRFVLPADMFRD